jgi:hypothetical protein
MQLSRLTATIAVILVSYSVSTAQTALDYLGYNAPAADLTTLFGPKVQELDASLSGFSFGGGDPTHPFRNLNLISTVYEADDPINIGVGVDGTNISLQPGDFTYAYTLDYSATGGIGTEASVNDFQLYRLIERGAPFVPASNPGPQIAFSEIFGGGYNTSTDFDTRPLEAYPAGLEYAEVFSPPILHDGFVEYAFPSSGQVAARETVMVFLFVSKNTTWMEIGGDSNVEGANIIGGGSLVDEIPALVPVVPEPGTFALSGLLCLFLLRRRY